MLHYVIHLFCLSAVWYWVRFVCMFCVCVCVRVCVRAAGLSELQLENDNNELKDGKMLCRAEVVILCICY